MGPEVVKAMNDTGYAILIVGFVLPICAFLPVMILEIACKLYDIFIDKD